LGCNVSGGDAGQRYPNYSRTYFVAWTKNIRRDVKIVCTYGEIRKIEKGTGNIQTGRCNIKQPPFASQYISSLCKRQTLYVVTALRAVLQQPNKSVDLADVLNNLIATER
jgi:hypothetical protein